VKRIAVLTTGGTIATKDVGGSGANPILTGLDLLQFIPEASRYAQVEVIAFDNLPGAHLTLERLVELAKRAEEILSGNVDGLVITHGTDTLEETAFFLYLTLNSPKPVVFTGSMRTASQIGYDGPRNLLDAIRVACSPEAARIGALVALNEEAHSARWVTKTHSQKGDTFKSPISGPIAIAYPDRIAFFAKPMGARRPLPKRIEPQVDLIRLALDCGDKFVRCSIETGAKGIVIEAFGGGRVPPSLLPSIREALARGIVVVIATRCFAGELWDPYGYQGAHRDLERMGAIFSHDLPGHKARLKLMLALANLEGTAEIKRYFEEE